jgi:hypothetical protein
MIAWQGLDKELETRPLAQEERRPKCQVPWEKIDEWLATVEVKCPKRERGCRILDAGDRRN